MHCEMRYLFGTYLTDFSFRRFSFSINSSVLCMVIGESVKKFWCLLIGSSVIVAVDSRLTIIFGVVCSRFSFGRLVGR